MIASLAPVPNWAFADSDPGIWMHTARQVLTMPLSGFFQ